MANSEDVSQLLKHFEDQVKVINTDSGPVYLAHPDEPGELGNVLYELSIGPIKTKNLINKETGEAQIELSLNIPIIGSVKLGNASGNLKDGITLRADYSGISSGVVSLKQDGKNVVQSWDATTLGQSLKGSVPLYSL